MLPASPFLSLGGCIPVPLAHYLKALAILRLVSERPDPAATCLWQDDVFQLGSTLNHDRLLNFFLREYAPTPVIAPWNGGSGFYPKDNRAAITAIEKSKASRLEGYRLTISQARKMLDDAKLKDKPDKDAKEDLLRACRNTLNDRALAWCDAAFVLGQDGAKYPPLLGTGGNDGRLEFTNNFMQRLDEVFDPNTGEPTLASENWLRQSLFAENVQTVVNKAPIGQFFPGAAGGANSTSGFDGASFVNPWDYLLMIEGALLFAAASTKKLESTEPGALVYPFCVRQAGVGYSSASLADEAAARSEMWLPLWRQPVTLAELAAIFGEGRAQVGGRVARNGVDFARAVVTLGVDRGIGAFYRYGFQVRNGLAYFATPLERVAVTRNPRADLLTDLDRQGWLDTFRRRAKDENAPAAAQRAILELDARILDLCRNKDAANVQSVLVALGRAEAVMARSVKWARPAPPGTPLRPAPLLGPGWLLAASENSTTEFRLAAALASVGGYYGREWLPLRCHLESVEPGGNAEKPFFKWTDDANDVVWHEGDPVAALNAVFARRLVRAEQVGADRNLPDFSRVPVSLDDVSAFIAGETDNELLASLLRGLSLLDWSKVKPEHRPALPSKDEATAPSALYALLKLCYQRPPADEKAIPLLPVIHRRAASGDGLEASRLAVRRLRASGFLPAVDEIPVHGGAVRRTAAALLLPLTPWQVGRLRLAVLRLDRESDFTPPDPVTAAAIHHLV